MRIAPRRPADIYKLPPGASSLADLDWHFHLLLRSCDAGEIASLAWGSSQKTQSAYGAIEYSIAPAKFGRHANGLKRHTHFYGNVIVLCDEPKLGVRTGRSVRDLGAMRKRLKHALGIGSGIATREHGPSLRGRVVATRPYDNGPDIPFDHALVVTDHVYSAAAKYQLVVPIVPGGVGVEVAEHVVRSAEEPWVDTVSDGTQEALLLVPLVQSVWQPDVIDVSNVQPVDAYTLKRVEEELCAFFRLSDGDAANC